MPGGGVTGSLSQPPCPCVGLSGPRSCVARPPAATLHSCGPLRAAVVCGHGRALCVLRHRGLLTHVLLLLRLQVHQTFSHNIRSAINPPGRSSERCGLTCRSSVCSFYATDFLNTWTQVATAAFASSADSSTSVSSG